MFPSVRNHYGSGRASVATAAPTPTAAAATTTTTVPSVGATTVRPFPGVAGGGIGAGVSVVHPRAQAGRACRKGQQHAEIWRQSVARRVRSPLGLERPARLRAALRRLCQPGASQRERERSEKEGADGTAPEPVKRERDENQRHQPRRDDCRALRQDQTLGGVDAHPAPIATEAPRRRGPDIGGSGLAEHLSIQRERTLIVGDAALTGN